MHEVQLTAISLFVSAGTNSSKRIPLERKDTARQCGTQVHLELGGGEKTPVGLSKC